MLLTLLSKKQHAQFLILIFSFNSCKLICGDQLITDQLGFVQSFEKELFQYHQRTNYFNKKHLRRAFFKIRIPLFFSSDFWPSFIEKDTQKAALFLAGFFLSKPFFVCGQNNEMQKITLPYEVIEKIIDYVDLTIEPILCEWVINDKQKMYNTPLYGIYFWQKKPDDIKSLGFNQFCNGKLIEMTKEAEKSKIINRAKPRITFSGQYNYEVFLGAIIFEHEKFDVVKGKYREKTRLEDASWQFLPQVFNYSHENKPFYAFHDTGSLVPCFQNEDGYLVEKRRFDVLYSRFSILFISPDWRTVCLVFPHQIDNFLKCTENEKQSFVRLSYDDANFLSKRIGEPKKLTLWLSIKRLFFPIYAYIKQCISSILLKLTNIVS